MLYRRFGKTGIKMPVFTCGGMRFQHSWVRSDTPPKKKAKDMEAFVFGALELGINSFDTANGYGTSEEELGNVLKGLPRESFCIQTKVPIRESADEFLRLFDESLSSLQLDYVDLFSLHGLNNEEQLQHSFKKGGCFDVALRLKEQGRVKNIGFSTHGVNDFIVKAIRLGDFDYVDIHWYYIFQDNLGAIKEAKSKDMGVLIISPSDKGGMLYAPTEKFKRLTSPLSPVIFNDLFCLSLPEVCTLTVGASSVDDFEVHIKALEYYEKREELLAPILDRLDNEYKKVLGEDWVATWQQGLPSWDETPGEINIPTILFLWNLVQTFDMINYGKKRFNLMGNGGHWFPGSRPTHIDSYDFSECLKGSPNAEKIPKILKEAFDMLVDKEVKRLGKH